jgi:hypothetical protein
VSVGVALLLFVLYAVVAFACASWFRNMLAVALLLLALPVTIVLHAALGSAMTVFALGVLVLAAVLIHTIRDTLHELRSASSRRSRAA